MTSDEIRETFLRFFEERGHQRVASSSLVPRADPSLLFVNAGMVQFKDVFLGRESRPYNRATTSQKCVRAGGKHNDLDSVGRTARHHTFFEMLGNFSFGDYFKRDAIDYGWTFLTQVIGLTTESLWITVYEQDDEAVALWQEVAGVPPERIVRLGEHDNFWAMGDTGPCGPCSEIIVDRGERLRCAAPTCGIGACDCDRWLEIWNLVFMQFDRDASGAMTPLPRPSIDTGMGLERVASILQDVPSNYDTDLFRPLIAQVEALSGVPYSTGPEGFPHRVIADHARACAFLIADGVLPGNEGRGYVLRRILRRAIRLGRKLGLDDPFMGRMARAAVQRMSDAYPDLADKEEFVIRVLDLEEERFSQTLDRGLGILQGMLEYRERNRGGLAEFLDFFKTRADSGNLEGILEQYGFAPSGSEQNAANVLGEGIAAQDLVDSLRQIVGEPEEEGDVTQEALEELGAFAARWETTVAGSESFYLYDTYGFPYELTEEIAGERGLSVDREGFEREMDAQRERARAAQRAGGRERATFRDYDQVPLPASEFLGHQTLVASGRLESLAGRDGALEEAPEGSEVEVVLDRTPFYAEGGGQVGDRGVLGTASGRVLVEDTFRAGRGIIVHRGRVEEGMVRAGEEVQARVDRHNRADTARNHTATHLLHAALRSVLGSHVQQAGSLVAPDRLRFDFSHIGSVTQEELAEVERLVNRRIREDWVVRPRTSSYQEALAEGALAFFDEKYGQVVRIVEVRLPENGRPHVPAEEEATFSKELCGGTHCASTGEIGYLHVVSESSIGAGMRRIEAVTGRAAEEFVRQRLGALEELGRQVGAPVAEVPAKIASVLDALDQERRRVQELQRELNRRRVDELAERAAAVDGVRYVSARVSAHDFDTLREMADLLRDRLESVVVVLGAVFNDRPNFLAAVTKDLVASGLNAGALVKDVATIAGGGGGGRPDMAQAGGRDVSKLEAALQQVPALLSKRILQRDVP